MNRVPRWILESGAMIQRDVRATLAGHPGCGRDRLRYGDLYACSFDASAAGPLKDGLLDVHFNTVMELSDFQDAAYRLVP
jgi:hypothetical protein